MYLLNAIIIIIQKSNSKFRSIKSPSMMTMSDESVSNGVVSQSDPVSVSTFVIAATPVVSNAWSMKSDVSSAGANISSGSGNAYTSSMSVKTVVSVDGTGRSCDDSSVFVYSYTSRRDVVVVSTMATGGDGDDKEGKSDLKNIILQNGMIYKIKFTYESSHGGLDCSMLTSGS